jgi:hypothetical protein
LSPPPRRGPLEFHCFRLARSSALDPTLSIDAPPLVFSGRRLAIAHGRNVTGACRLRLETIMTVKILRNEKGNPPGKLADAELHFSEGPLGGLKLIGFAVWERKSGGRNVTFPARQYSVNGERRSFALLRPIVDTTSQDQIREVILQAYAEHEAEAAVAS